MRNPGLEPGSLAALEPESSASANSASSADIELYLHHSLLLLLNYLHLSRKNLRKWGTGNNTFVNTLKPY